MLLPLRLLRFLLPAPGVKTLRLIGSRPENNQLVMLFKPKIKPSHPAHEKVRAQ
jgi:hypothetical protein